VTATIASPLFRELRLAIALSLHRLKQWLRPWANAFHPNRSGPLAAKITAAFNTAALQVSPFTGIPRRGFAEERAVRYTHLKQIGTRWVIVVRLSPGRVPYHINPRRLNVASDSVLISRGDWEYE